MLSLEEKSKIYCFIVKEYLYSGSIDPDNVFEYGELDPEIEYDVVESYVHKATGRATKDARILSGIVSRLQIKN